MFGRRGFLASLVACLFAPIARVWGADQLTGKSEAAGQIDWDELRAATIEFSGEGEKNSTILKVRLKERILVTVQLKRSITIQELCVLARNPGAVWDVIRAEKRYKIVFETTGPTGIRAETSHFKLTVKDGVRGVSSC